MSNKKDEIEVELEPDANGKKDDEIVVVAAETSPEPIIPPEDGIKELRAQLERERQARINAEKKAYEATQQAYTASNEVQDTHWHLVNQAIDTLKRDNDIFKNNYRDAMTVGDYEKAAEINQLMTSNTIKLDELEEGKHALENRPKVEPPKPIPVDPVEALASQLTTRSASWVRSHPEYATNPALYQKMVLAHQMAVADGIQADTDEYFRSVEETLKIAPKKVVEQPRDEAMSDAAKVTQHRSAPPAAPVARVASNGRIVARLSAEEREMASLMGMTEQEYAKNREALRREGRYN